MTKVMEIRPASLEQVQASPDGAWVAVDATVGEFAKKIDEIETGDSELTLHLNHNTQTGIWAVFQRLPNGDEELLQTSTELDDRLVLEVQRIVARKRNGRKGDLVRELQAGRAARDRELQHAEDEKLGDLAEKSIHALRSDLGVTDRAFIDKGIE